MMEAKDASITEWGSNPCVNNGLRDYVWQQRYLNERRKSERAVAVANMAQIDISR